jgi:iron complex transport system substrate-binding protein
MEKKQILKFIAVFAAAAVLSIPADAKTVRDAAGRSVEIPAEVKRIAVTPMPWAAVVWGLDGGSSKRLAAIHPNSLAQYKRCYLSQLDPDFARIPTNAISRSFDVNVEEMLKLRPDVVLLWDSQSKDAEKLAAVGIPSVMIKYAINTDILYDDFRIIGEVLGREKEIQRMIEYHKKAREYFKDFSSKIPDDKKPRVLVMRVKPLRAACRLDYEQFMLDLTGAENAAGKLENEWLEVNLEQILAWNPDIIYLTNFEDVTPEDLYENKIPGVDLHGVNAVKKHHVYKKPAGIYNWDAPCLETAIAMEWYAEIQHPEAAEFNFYNDLKAFYKEFFNIELTDADISEIIHTGMNGPLM